MLSATQIVLLCIIGVCAVLSIIFMIMFAVEITVEPKEEETNEEQEENKEVNAGGDVYVTQNIVLETNTTKEASVSEMLANLEEQSKEETVETVNESTEVVEVQPEQNENVEESKDENQVVEETVEEVKTEEVVAEEEKTEEIAAEETSEKEEKTEEVAVQEVTEEYAEGDHQPIVSGSLDDLKARLEKITESREKIDKDLSKLQKLILNYDRTKRRMTRNQKMLDRKASELTNLNLVMYSVTDIKNVDEEKKQKQEELTAHIAELKASIQDADEFITSNKEKNDHNVKMAKFLIQEKSRYNEEIAELEELIKKAEDSTENV